MSNHITKHHADSPNGHDDLSHNPSRNPSLETVMQARLARRSLFKGGVGLAASGLLGTGLAACGGGSDATPATPSSNTGGNNTTDNSLKLGFGAVPKHLDDVLTVPAGYTATVLYRLGDPIDTATPAYANDGTDTAASFTRRAGDHHDGMAFFGLNATGTAKDLSNASRGLLAMNHENITQVFLHSATEVTAGFNKASRVPAQIDKEVNAHGISVIELLKSAGSYSVNTLSGFNRRLTAISDMDLYGPVRGNALVTTRYSTSGQKTRGTLNNCANGVTPWGTYLTCEENWAGYFKRPASSTLAAKEMAAQNRYMGSAADNGSYGWANPTGGDASADGQYARWDVTPSGATAADDFRNAANTFGWVVEIDPFAPSSTPRKRTAMGRFGHEGAMPAKAVAGKPIVYYMGDDSRGEYIYKFVSTQGWDPADANGGLTAGNKYLDSGKLYVAKYNADGTGNWLELDVGATAVAGATYGFADQADVLVNARIAADALGATPMDRPEWTGVNPLTGEIYVTLTNNSDRGKTGTTTGGKSRALDAANPRYYADDKAGSAQTGNVNGHIIRMKENGSDASATAFQWDVYLFGAESGAGASVNLSGLSATNDFSSPDGLWFSQATPGLLWLETDDGAYTDVTNCMLLAALPGRHGDGASVQVANQAVPANGNAAQTVTTYKGANATDATLKRFLVGPKGCEITGVAETPDGKALFVNIQHPGEDTTAANIGTPANYQSHWPQGGTARPRSSTVVITKDDGGVIGG